MIPHAEIKVTRAEASAIVEDALRAIEGTLSEASHLFNRAANLGHSHMLGDGQLSVALIQFDGHRLDVENHLKRIAELRMAFYDGSGPHA